MLAQDYPLTLACDVLSCARSSYYHQPTERADEAELRAAINAALADPELIGESQAAGLPLLPSPGEVEQGGAEEPVPGPQSAGAAGSGYQGRELRAGWG